MPTVLVVAAAWAVVARAPLFWTTGREPEAPNSQLEAAPADRRMSAAAMMPSGRPVRLRDRPRDAADGHPHGRDHHQRARPHLRRARADGSHLPQDAPRAPSGAARRAHAAPTRSAPAGEGRLSSAFACVSGWSWAAQTEDGFPCVAEATRFPGSEEEEAWPPARILGFGHAHARSYVSEPKSAESRVAPLLRSVPQYPSLRRTTADNRTSGDDDLSRVAGRYLLLRESRALPRPMTADLNFQGEAQEGPHGDDQRQDANVAEGRVDHDRPDDVCGDQEL